MMPITELQAIVLATVACFALGVMVGRMSRPRDTAASTRRHAFEEAGPGEGRPMLSTRWKQYRIVRDRYAGWEVQVKWWPIPVWWQAGVINTHASRERALRWAEGYARTGSELI